tara:strand:- start:3566 stop:5443 length:1878 start_codon:yes stop_codon:yes gene_type:complete
MAIDWKERDLAVERRLAEFEARAQARRDEAARKAIEKAEAAARQSEADTVVAQESQEAAEETPARDRPLVHPNDPLYTNDPESEHWAGMVTGGPAYSGEETEVKGKGEGEDKSGGEGISMKGPLYATHEIADSQRVIEGEPTLDEYLVALEVEKPVRFELSGTAEMRDAKHRNPKWDEYYRAQRIIGEYENERVEAAADKVKGQYDTGEDGKAVNWLNRPERPIGFWNDWIGTVATLGFIKREGPEWDAYLNFHKRKSERYWAIQAARDDESERIRKEAQEGPRFTDVEGLTEQFRRTTEEGYGGPPPSYGDRTDTRSDYEKSLEEAAQDAPISKMTPDVPEGRADVEFDKEQYVYDTRSGKFPDPATDTPEQTAAWDAYRETMLDGDLDEQFEASHGLRRAFGRPVFSQEKAEAGASDSPTEESEAPVIDKASERPYKKAAEAYIGPMQEVESFGGKSDASNPISSAYGASQFTKGTWMGMIKKYRPDLMEGRTKEEVLALRSNYKLDYEMVTRFTEENAAKLDRLGHPLTRRNLYLMHFAGSTAAPKLLKAPEGDKASNYVSSKAQKSNPSVFWYGDRKKDKNGNTVYYYEGKQKYPVWIHAHNPPKYKSVKQVLDWAEKKMG